MTLPRTPQRILVIVLRRLGDVLLATALIRSVRRAWPQAELHVLVEAGVAGMLEGNPDIARVHVQPPRHEHLATWSLLRHLWRQYDLAVAAHSSDRAHLWALAAAPHRAGVVPPSVLPGARWKRWSCEAWTELHLGDLHTVEQYLRLVDAMCIGRSVEVVPPSARSEEATLPRPYAVLHPAPMFSYKEWTIEGWQQLARYVMSRGVRVVFSAGPGARDREIVGAIRSGLVDCDARMHETLQGGGTLAALAEVLRGASLYVGPDTSVTHLAAAVGVPTVALFGPSPPVEWGPWPVEGGEQGVPSPWQHKAALQQRGNVWLVQGEGDCVPCLKEGCDRHRGSRSRCLDDMPAGRVIAIADRILPRA